MTVRLPQAHDPSAWAGARWPLGAHYDPAASRVTFAVHAPAATRVQLELYATAIGAAAVASFECARGDDGAWRAQVDNVGPGALYGFRCWGRNWPFEPGWTPGSAAGFRADLDDDGNRFNPNKLLFDPYARELSHNLLDPGIAAAGADGGWVGTGGQEHHGRPRRELDSGPYAPKGIVLASEPRTFRRPGIDPHDAAIYEAHVRSLTRHPSALRLGDLFAHTPGFEAVRNVPRELQGTYAGAAHLAPYLAALGLTTIELLPVMEMDCLGDDATTDSGPTNYWGYQTLAFFAPNRRYSADRSPGGPTREFRAMIDAFHDAGLEVYLDVVYNHTGEGGHWGDDLGTTGFTSLGGFATADYYVLTDEHRLVDGATGCSNQVNFSSDASQRLALDSLAYWHDELGVDGFRFDLAPVLGRRPDDAARHDWEAQRRFFPTHPLLTRIAQWAQEQRIEVVAEAWDLWGYEVGNFPAGWGEWNGRFRDVVRAFAKGDGNAPAFMDLFNGDFAHFHDQGGPARSINFVTAHDGFTLMDLVSFPAKNNAVGPPFGPSDGGADTNLSWDSGGDQALRRARARALLAILFLARGVPMIVSGDEYGRTQNGNNNPWAIDTVGIWNNWAQAVSRTPTRLAVDPTDSGAGAYFDVFGAAASPDGVNPVFAFTRAVARLRREHPALRQRDWGDAAQGGDDVSYLFASPVGGTPTAGDRAVAVRIDASHTGGGDLLVLVAMTDEPCRFVVPAPTPGHSWRRIIDTGVEAEAEGNAWPLAAAAPVQSEYVAHRWSVAVLQEAEMSG